MAGRTPSLPGTARRPASAPPVSSSADEANSPACVTRFPDDSVPEADVRPTLFMVASIRQTELPILMKNALDDPEVTVAAIGGGVLALAMAGLIEGHPVVTITGG
jgi:hypothetical protein